MNEPTIICPKCKSEVKLTDAMAAPLIEGARREMAAKLAQEKSKISEEAKREANAAVETELRRAADEVVEVNRKLVANTAKLQDAQKAQAEAVARGRELDDRERELNLTIEKRVSAGVQEIRASVKAEVETEIGGKLSEKQLLLDRMANEVADLKKKLEQGSQQAQGEVLELELENELRVRFVFDAIEPVAKGVFGGDVIQRVNENMKHVGTIIWEIKRTKNWTEGWLAKLRGDQRNAKAEVAVIVTMALPDGVESFGMREGIWITTPKYAIALCACLRHGMAEVHGARESGDGQETKMEMVYKYLTGPNFKHRVSAIVENFGNMLEDLDKEKRVQEKVWAKREGQIRTAMKAAAGMYGDLQGIAGTAVGELPALDVKQLEESTSRATA